MIKKPALLFLLNLLFTFTIAVVQTPAQSNLLEKKITIEMEKQPLGKVFRELIYKYGINIGFEESLLDKDHDDYAFETNLPLVMMERNLVDDKGNRVSLKFEQTFYPKSNFISINAKNESLQKVLDEIVSQMKYYQWEINDDVINIFPNKSRNKNYEDLLNLQIKNFSVEKGLPVGIIRNNIFELPEIVDFVKESKIYSTNERRDLSYVLDKLPSDIKFSDMNLRTLLNQIVKLKGGGWILKFNKRHSTEEKEYIEIQI